jgi:hypothetical protein
MLRTKVAEKSNIHFIFNNFFLKNHAICEIMWKKYGTARQANDENIIQRMRIAGWILKATNTHSEHVMLFAFPSQQRLCERASMLR